MLPADAASEIWETRTVGHTVGAPPTLVTAITRLGLPVWAQTTMTTRSICYSEPASRASTQRTYVKLHFSVKTNSLQAQGLESGALLL